MPTKGSSTSALKKLSPTLMEIPADEVGRPVIPPPNMVGEGRALDVACGRHRQELLDVGIGEDLIGELPVRIDALAEAQAQLLNARTRNKRTQEEIDLEQQCYAVRQEIIDAARYALRKNPQAQSTIDEVVEGTGLDDLIQDLVTLATYCETYSKELGAIKDFLPAKKAAQAKELASKLSAEVAERKAGDKEETEVMNLRDRAATYLWEGMSELRAAGTYAFRANPAEQTHFKSQYKRRKPRKKTPEE